MAQPIFVGDSTDLVQVGKAPTTIPRCLAVSMQKQLSQSDAFPHLDEDALVRVLQRLRSERWNVHIQTVAAVLGDYLSPPTEQKLYLRDEVEIDEVVLSRVKVSPLPGQGTVASPKLSEACLAGLPSLVPSAFDSFESVDDMDALGTNPTAVAGKQLQTGLEDDMKFQIDETSDIDMTPIARQMVHGEYSSYIYKPKTTLDPATKFDAYLSTPLGNIPPPLGTIHRDRFTGIAAQTINQELWKPFERPPVLDGRSAGRKIGHSHLGLVSDPALFPSTDRGSSRIRKTPQVYGETVNGFRLLYVPGRLAPAIPPKPKYFPSRTKPANEDSTDPYYRAFHLQLEGETIATFSNPHEAVYKLHEMLVSYKGIMKILGYDDVDDLESRVHEASLRARVSKRKRWLETQERMEQSESC